MPALIRKIALITITTLLFTACGGGSESSSGSGIGGTGITLIKGNVTSVNNQSVTMLGIEESSNLADYLVNSFIPVSFAQVAGVSNLTVSGGGQTAEVNSDGQFTLPDVAPSDNFVLTFTVDGRQNINLGIGQVNKGAVVTVKNIAIDTRSGTADPGEIDKEETEEDDTSNDADDQISDDDENSEDADDQDSVDDADDQDSVDDAEEDDHPSDDKK